jgi:hypothetical protein
MIALLFALSNASSQQNDTIAKSQRRSLLIRLVALFDPGPGCLEAQ